MNNLIWLDANDEEKISQVALLHEKLLNESPIPQFGRYFMKKFYYKKLISSNLIHCLFYLYRSKVAGFIVITEYPGKFMINGFFNHIFFLSYTFIRAIFKKPARILKILKLIMVGMKRKSAHANNKTSELLSIAVDTKYRKHRDAQSGLRISHALFQGAAKFLKNNGNKRFNVITDKNNDRAISFYKNYEVELIDSNFYDNDEQLLFSLDLNNFQPSKNINY